MARVLFKQDGVFIGLTTEWDNLAARRLNHPANKRYRSEEVAKKDCRKIQKLANSLESRWKQGRSRPVTPYPKEMDATCSNCGSTYHGPKAHIRVALCCQPIEHRYQVGQTFAYGVHSPRYHLVTATIVGLINKKNRRGKSKITTFSPWYLVSIPEVSPEPIEMSEERIGWFLP